MPGLRRYVEFGAPPVLIAIVSAAWSVWAVRSAGGDLEAAWMGGTVIPALLDEGAQLWRLLCAGWLHTAPAHALSNLAGLLLPALALARVARPRAVYPVWALGALAGCLMSWAFTRTWAHGASAGNAGLAAAVGCLGAMRWRTLDGQTRRWVVAGSVPWIVFLVLPRAQAVDHWAHLGGALAGPLGVLLGHRAAVGFGLAHAAAFGWMLHTAGLPPADSAVLRVDGWRPVCAGAMASDGLVAVCRVAPGVEHPATAQVSDTHAMQVVGRYAVFGPPGARVQRVIDDGPGRFFDGSADPR